MAEVSQAIMPVTSWRLKLGVALFGLSIAVPMIGVPLVAVMGLSATTIATISGAMLVGAEVLGIVAVAIMGKSGYAFIKNRVFGFLKQYGPPAEVSRIRYTIGLLMFSLPIVFGNTALAPCENSARSLSQKSPPKTNRLISNSRSPIMQ
jgi:hypothetical protein